MRYVGFAWLWLVVITGCSTSASTSDAGDTDGGAEDASTDGGSDRGRDGGRDSGSTGDEDAGTGKKDSGGGDEDAGKDSGSDDEDAGDEVLTCEDTQIECGIIEDDGLGNELDCSDPEGNPTGTEKACDESYQGCTDNKCECLVETPEVCAIGEVECGVANTCEPGGETCDLCGELPGANRTCDTDTRKCVCPKTTKPVACGDRVCGAVPDGCGDTYSCGTCSEARTCADDGGTCACLPPSDDYRETVCGDAECGTVFEDGCPFYCGDLADQGSCSNECGAGEDCSAGCDCPTGQSCGGSGSEKTCCEPRGREDLCSADGVECGDQVTDDCSGETFTCGCEDGKGCADVQFVKDATENHRVCIDEYDANLVGKYLARTHAFNAGTGSDISRGETLSLVTITREEDGSLHMRDEGCVATTTNDASFRLRSVAVGYWRLPPAEVPLKRPSDEDGPPAGGWLRERASVGPAVGFRPQQPSFCGECDTEGGCAPESSAGEAGVPGSGSVKPWLGGDDGAPCTCVRDSETCATSAADSDCMPAQNTNAVSSVDCRINDIDADSGPGFRISFEGAYSVEMSVATVAGIRWEGTVDAAGMHRGHATEPDPTEAPRSILGCEGFGSGFICTLAQTAASDTCGPMYNRIQFVKLRDTDQDLTCSNFYKGVDLETGIAEDLSDVDQVEINQKFSDIGPDCASNADCPVGMICHKPDDVCWPMTTPGACGGAGTCEGTTTPGTWTCKVDDSCWPADCE